MRKYLSTTGLLVFAFLLMFFCSCTKEYNDIIINIGNGSESGIPGGSGNGNTGNDSVTGTLNKVNFWANIESLKSTKTLSAFSEGRFATVYVYPAGGSMEQSPLFNNLYTTNSPGTLTPVNSAIYLSDGSYNIYSVATNQTSNMDPVFDKGESASVLQNGIDYLWWGTVGQTIETSPENLQIVFRHACAQVVVKLVAGNGVTINSTQSATIMPPLNTASMNLSTGIITPATSFSSTPLAMGVSNNICQATILPLNNVTSIAATFNLLINGETSTRNFEVKIPVPAEGFTYGNSYLYEAIVSSNTISFNQVSVINWVVVDETGTPLYPEEI